MSHLKKLSLVLVLCSLFLLPFYGHPYIRIVIGIALIIWLLMDVLKMKTLKPSWQEFFLFFLLIIGVCSAIFRDANVQSPINYAILTYGTPVLLLFCIRRICISRTDWLWLGYAYLAGCIVSSLIVIIGWLTIGSNTELRFSVGELNANYISYSIATGVSIALIIALLEKNKKYNDLLLLIVIPLSLAVLLSGTRGAIISILASIAIFYSYQIIRRPLKFFFSLLVLLAFGIVFLNLIPEHIYLRVFDNSSNDISSGRLELWTIAVSLIKESPFTGHGIEYFKAQSPLDIDVHNVFLALLVEFGILGLLLYIVPLFSILTIRCDSKEVRKARLLFIVSWLPIAMTGIWQFSIAPWFVFAWLINIPKALKYNVE